MSNFVRLSKGLAMYPLLFLNSIKRGKMRCKTAGSLRGLHEKHKILNTYCLLTYCSVTKRCWPGWITWRSWCLCAAWDNLLDFRFLECLILHWITVGCIKVTVFFFFSPIIIPTKVVVSFWGQREKIVKPRLYKMSTAVGFVGMPASFRFVRNVFDALQANLEIESLSQCPSIGRILNLGECYRGFHRRSRICTIRRDPSSTAFWNRKTREVVKSLPAQHTQN